MVRSISDADRAGDQEGERHRDQQRIVEQHGIVVADDLLHHEGRVGAEHHHLAMRHVDDAHDAEGDGKADRREQQHRAERQAVPGVLHHVPDCERMADRSPCAAAAACTTAGGWSAAGRRAARARPGRRGRGSRRWRRSCLRLGSLSDEDDGGARLFERPLAHADPSPWPAPCRDRAARSSRDLNTACAAS